jgi:hypothetical protein
LREFQRLTGWINWSLNVFPLLKPGLSNLYAKIAGKDRAHARIMVSSAVVKDLLWLAKHVEASSGTNRLLGSQKKLIQLSIVMHRFQVYLSGSPTLAKGFRPSYRPTPRRIRSSSSRHLQSAQPSITLQVSLRKPTASPSTLTTRTQSTSSTPCAPLPNTTQS